MRGVGLCLKALLMIFLTISISFLSSDLSFASADEEESNVCCERTTSGDSCVYTAESNCDEDYLPASTTCEQTSFCEVGCCVSDVGKCSQGVARSACESIEGYSWNEGSDCSTVDACEKNCCVIAESQCSYTTEAHCEFLIQDLEDITLDWRDVDSENSCTDICQASDKGCCVSSEGCVYGTQAECENPSVDLTEGTGFYKDSYCSEHGSCGCTKHDDKQCIDEDVYWFDSCGNQEGIVQAGDVDSNGDVVTEDGDCDYTSGTWCGADDSGEVICESTNCYPTFNGVYALDGSDRNPHDEKIGEEREHGESWCLYESPAGGWFDRPGSQHYRVFCYFGEEIIEPCEDYREKVCIQYPYTDYFQSIILDPVEEWKVTDGESYDGVDLTESGSACIDNGIYQNLVNANVTSVPLGAPWDDASLVDTCARGSVSCPVTFAKDTSLGEWHCVNNCYCLTQEWTDEAAGFCSVQGDCGPKYNLVGDDNSFNSDGFFVTKSQDYVGDVKKSTGETREETFVGYDENCKVEYSEPGENPNPKCTKYCKDEDLTQCDFIYQQGEERTASLGEQYGVYGNMVAFSQALQTFSEDTTYMATISSFTPYLYVGAAAFTLTAFIVGSLLTVGVGTHVTALSGLLPAINAIFTSSTVAGPFGWAVAAVVVAVLLVVTAIITSGGESMTVTVSSACGAWQPPAGSENCELCDIPVSEGGLAIDDGFGNILTGWECTEYKCRSLGNSCEYIPENQGTTRPKCVGIEANDVNHPKIEKFMVDVSDEMNSKGVDDTDGYIVASTEDYSFAADTYLEFIEPIDPYQFVTFGIELDEPGQCKIQEGGEPPTDYFTMPQYFPDSYVDYTHNQTWILTPDEEFIFYIRCWDRAREDGNVHEHDFQVQITTTDGEDITAPQIEATDIVNGAYVAAGVSETLLAVYVDEPAQCKWSTSDAEYSLMENSFVCPGVPDSPSAYFENSCTGVLDVMEGTNSYYFACEDAAGNNNIENYPFSLVSTVPLLIDSVSPSGTLYYDYTTLAVQTSEGAEGGKALCSYDGIPFYETDSSFHQQPLEDLAQGEYSYDISCTDVAGNIITSEILFTIDVDIQAPALTSVYKLESTVYFTLDEEASCEYYFEEFDFGQGASISSSFPLTDLTEYFLTCQDIFGNEGDWEIHV